MKAREFRLGNIVYRNESNDGTGAIENNIVFVDKNVMFEIERGNKAKFYDPVPVTDKLLFNFGFNGNFDVTFHVPASTDYHVRRPYIVGSGIWIFRHKSGIELTKFRYAHELQNIFYALVGKELVYKP